MALIKCKKCYKEINRNEVYCPSCGARNKKKTHPVTKRIGIGLGAIILFPIIASMIVPERSTPAPKAKAQPEKVTVPEPARVTTISAEIIIGQWREKISNPKYKNSVSNRYNRHSFFDDGSLVVESKQNESTRKKWAIEDNLLVVKSSYNKSQFTEHYKLVNNNRIDRIKFIIVMDGKHGPDRNRITSYYRQGSEKANNLNIVDIFQASSKAMDFIDPNTLTHGAKYVLSKRTPLMPYFKGTNASSVKYIDSGDTIKILERKNIKNSVWYEVETNTKKGWIKSTALFGQKLS